MRTDITTGSHSRTSIAMQISSCRLRAWLAIAGLLAFARSSDGQTGATGTIEGRVSNSRNAEYLEKARISVVGAGLETLTDTGGHYRITNVPAGTATVKAFFTGLEVQT